MIPDWTSPVFFPNRLQDKIPCLSKERNAIVRVTSPARPVVFVGSMCDLWGSWVNPQWIIDTLVYCNNHREADFYFLTKNPSRYLEFKEYFRDNMVFGCTKTGGDCFDAHMATVSDIGYRIFLSAEPVLSTYENISMYDMVFAGAMTGSNAVAPEKLWIDSLRQPNVFFKTNIHKFI
jgi:protein gp37